MIRIPPRRGETSGVIIRTQTNGTGQTKVVRPAVITPNIYK